jgi:DNA invertase Pin-like site-specific DNA recombinase
LQIQASSKLSETKRMIDILFEKLQAGDTLIVNELSRLGRSLGQVIQIIDKLTKHEIKFLALKENIILDGK